MIQEQGRQELLVNSDGISPAFAALACTGGFVGLFNGDHPTNAKQRFRCASAYFRDAHVDDIVVLDLDIVR